MTGGKGSWKESREVFLPIIAKRADSFSSIFSKQKKKDESCLQNLLDFLFAMMQGHIYTLLGDFRNASF